GENIDRRFDFVVDCRGTGARASLNALRTVRGESILLHAPEVSLKRPIRMLHPRYPLYVVPREHNHYLIGATQIESDDLSPISVQSVLELLSSAVLLHPGFKDSRIVTLGANCRPAFFDNRPKIIVRSKSMFINGLFRHGFMCAPAILSECVSFLECGHFSDAFSQAFVVNEN
ncbi:MAG: FAD-dependent oxidoreductase, partial [Leptolyngbya sp.]|nr:FAD-dependent oxidoreductase [Candidatus Melainabacteria bacterium]